MLSGEGNAENGKKKKLGLISKKATLQVHHTCFVLFFPVVSHEYNMKLPETSWLKVLWRKWRITFFLFTIFFFSAANIHVGGH